MGERTLISVRTISATLEEFAFNCLVIVILVLEVTLEILSTLGLIESSPLVHPTASTAAIVTPLHVRLHTSWIALEVVIASLTKVATTTTAVVLSLHSVLLVASSEVSLLIAVAVSVALPVYIWRSRLYWHSSHCRGFLMFRDGLN